MSNLITLDRSGYAWARAKENGRVNRSGPTGNYESLKYPLRQSPLISCATRSTWASGEDSRKLLSSQPVENSTITLTEFKHIFKIIHIANLAA